MPLHLVERLPAQIVLLEQMAEAAHRRLIRHRFAAEIDADKIAHCPRIVERLFHRRVRQVEPLLEEIDAQHPLHPDRRAAIASFGIERLNQTAQCLPRHHPLHLGQKPRPPRRPGVALKPRRRQRKLLHLPHPCALIHPAAHYITITGRWLLQWFPREAGPPKSVQRMSPLTMDPLAEGTILVTAYLRSGVHRTRVIQYGYLLRGEGNRNFETTRPTRGIGRVHLVGLVREPLASD